MKRGHYFSRSGGNFFIIFLDTLCFPLQNSSLQKEVCMAQNPLLGLEHQILSWEKTIKANKAPKEGDRDFQEFALHHAFRIWELMTGVKSLQRTITYGGTHWLPPALPEEKRLIQEIFTTLETAPNRSGQTTSLFELFLRSAPELSWDPRPIQSFLSRIAVGAPPDLALNISDISRPIRQSVLLSVRTMGSPVHQSAAYFLSGHCRQLAATARFLKRKGDLSKTPYFSEYLERIAFVEDRLNSISSQLLKMFTQGSATKINESCVAARMSWTAVLPKGPSATTGNKLRKSAVAKPARGADLAR